MAKPVIWTVDDDPDVLRAVERDLRRQYGNRYRVMAADSGQAHKGIDIRRSESVIFCPISWQNHCNSRRYCK
jgi:hypothetical protein